MRTILSFVHFSTILMFFWVGMYVYFADRKNTLNRIFLHLCAVSLIVSIGYFITCFDYNTNIIFISQYVICLRVLSIVLLLRFAVVYTGNISFNNKFFTTLFYISAVIIMALNIYSIMNYEKIVLKPWGYSIEQHIPNIIDKISLFWMLILITLRTYIFINYHFTINDKDKKNETVIITVVSLIPFFAGFITEGLLPIMKIDFPSLTNILTGGIVLFLGYIIVRYKYSVVGPETAAQSIVQNMKDFMLLIDKNGKIVKINPSLCKTTGYSENEILGSTADVLFRIKDKSYDELLADIYINKYIEIPDAVCKTREGKEIPVYIKISAVENKSLFLHGFVWLATDVSYFSEINKMKNNFISVVSHELRTPLTSILGFLAFLLKQDVGPINEKQTEYLNIVKSSSKRLLKLINELLDISKIESGTFSVEKAHFDIIPVINDSIKQILPLAEAKHITFENKIEKDSYIVNADDYRIPQVIINLLGNSIKFSFNNSKIMICVCEKNVSDINKPVYSGKLPETTEKVLMISIKDEGPGLMPGLESKIFEKFFQVETSGVGRHQGVGLGLTISKNIIEAHDGLLWAESEGINKGTTFYIVLPAIVNSCVDNK